MFIASAAYKWRWPERRIKFLRDASDLGEATSDAAAALGEAAKESATAFAARVQDNVGKTDFAARNARLQERVAGALAQP